MCVLGTAARKEGYLIEYLERLRCCFQTSKTTEGIVKALSDVHSLLQILESVCEHAGEEQVEEDWCKHTALPHSFFNHKKV